MAGKHNATKSGERIERFIAQPLLDAGFVLLDQTGRTALRESGPKSADLYNPHRPFFATHITIPGVQSVYLVDWTLDVFLWHFSLMPLGMVLECKWQSSSGSCDEKLPFTIQSLSHLCGSKRVDHAGLMLEANGMRECARQYARQQCPRMGISLFEGPSSWAAWVQKNLVGRNRKLANHP